MSGVSVDTECERSVMLSVTVLLADAYGGQSFSMSPGLCSVDRPMIAMTSG